MDLSLFKQLPDGIFRPLAAINRRFYAALLMHLYEGTFNTAGATPRLSDLLAEIGDFVDQFTQGSNAFIDDDPEMAAIALKVPKGQDVRRYTIYRTLLDTGWLIELRDRYRKLVDLSPAGGLLLRELHRIASGDSRSYGGMVLNVLANLENAIRLPLERSENVRNAWHFSRDFAQHLRTVAAQMRLIENQFSELDTVGKLLRSFFQDFVSEVLITDYKTLHTKNNPFRFRRTIIDRVQEIEEHALIISQLSQGYVREGRSKTVGAAEELIRRELHDIYATFENVDNQLDIINETQFRLERRIHTAIKYMDRSDGHLIERLTNVLRGLGAQQTPDNATIDIEPNVLHFRHLIGDWMLARETAPRPPLGRMRVVANEPDPALLAFEKAREEYSKTVTVTPTKMREFIEKVLVDRSSILGSEISVETVYDYIVFQRLREADFIFDGILARNYQIERFNARTENEWQVFSEFRLSRTEQQVKA